jgi:hypothetical protein
MTDKKKIGLRLCAGSMLVAFAAGTIAFFGLPASFVVALASIAAVIGLVGIGLYVWGGFFPPGNRR